MCEVQFRTADNMTDQYGALQALSYLDIQAFMTSCNTFLQSNPGHNTLKVMVPVKRYGMAYHFSILYM